jgi:hypothetical protein
MNRHEHRGSCHCGNLRWTLRSELSLPQLPVRTCGCRFCSKHGLLTTSDPQGEMEFILPNHTAVLRHRFDTEPADFLMWYRQGSRPAYPSASTYAKPPPTRRLDS